MKEIYRIGEFGLIENLKKYAIGSKGCQIGDDAAEWQPPPGENIVLSCDVLVDGVHFSVPPFDWYQVGRKIAAANLSDMAAMGAQPAGLLLGCTIPGSFLVRNLEELYRGLSESLTEEGAFIAGGDTVGSAGSGKPVFSATIWGSVDPAHVLHRAGAKPGDVILVSGGLGGARAGQMILLDENGDSNTLNPKLREVLINRFLEPRARVKAGKQLAALNLATSAIDVSDGLSSDITRLSRESRVGVEIDAEKIPLFPGVRDYAELNEYDPVSFALASGEEYELLFTAREKDVGKIKSIINNTEVIGKIIDYNDGLILLKKEKGKIIRKILSEEGWDHFRFK